VIRREPDHLVWAVPDLKAAVADLESRLGVRAAPGGRHAAWSTRNALIALGPDRYLEILAPDPEAPAPPAPRPCGIDALEVPRLATWAAKGAGLEAMVARAVAVGVDLGPVREGSRRRPDGLRLSWRMTAIEAPRLGGVVPFFVDWGGSPHPALDAPAGCELLDLRAEHPEPGAVRPVLGALGVALRVDPGPAPALAATIRSPRGTVTLR
jgi:hypothetical protein